MKLALPVFVLVVLSISIFATNYCSSLEQYQQKSEFYQGLSGSQEKLAVYGMTAEQVVQVLKSIDSSIEMMKQLCEKEKASASSAVQAREAAAIVTAATAATTQGTAVIGTAAGGQGSTATGTQGIGGRVNITEGTVTANIVGVGSPIANATNTRIIADGNVVNTHAVAIIPSTQIVVRPVNSSEGIIPVPLPPPEIAVPSLPPATGSSLARFAYWWGKVTMVQTTSGSWAPASNLRDGANINPLTYCQQLNSRSLGVREVGKQSISGWINRDGIADSQATLMRA